MLSSDVTGEADFGGLRQEHTAPSDAEIVYLDASAAIKLVGNEWGSKRVRRFLQRSLSSLIMTQVSFCVALGTLRARRNHRQVTARSVDRCRALATCLENDWIRLVDVPMAAAGTVLDARGLAEKYGLDDLEAMQLVTLRLARSAAAAQTPARLVTASESLAHAARREGLHVWNCLKEPPPA